MDRAPHRLGMSLPFRIFLLLLVLGVVWMLFKPMGEGSPRYARKWMARLASIESVAQAARELPEAVTHRFEDGEWVVGVCKDSHGSPWGGTIVVKDSRGEVRAFFGHVCGPGFIKMILSRMRADQRDDLDGFYETIGRSFEEYEEG